MEHGTLVAWLKREGESFSIGEPLYEVESEKANLEIEAFLSESSKVRATTYQSS